MKHLFKGITKDGKVVTSKSLMMLSNKPGGPTTEVLLTGHKALTMTETSLASKNDKFPFFVSIRLDSLEICTNADADPMVFEKVDING